MLPLTVSHGNRLGSWNINPRSALGSEMGLEPTSSSPEVGESRPAMRRRRVDLPQPLGPISDTISPARTVSDIPFRARTLEPSGARNDLLTPRTNRESPSVAVGGEVKAVTT